MAMAGAIHDINTFDLILFQSVFTLPVGEFWPAHTKNTM